MQEEKRRPMWSKTTFYQQDQWVAQYLDATRKATTPPLLLRQWVKIAQSCLTLQPHAVYGILHAKILEWVTFPFSRGSFQLRDWTRSPALQVDSLPAEPQGKPKSTGMGSLSLLQGIFPTQELNQGLLKCRRILYQLSYQGSPYGVSR